MSYRRTSIERISNNYLRFNVKEKSVPYLFIAPFLIIFTIFFIIPSIYSLYLSFCNYAGFGKITFVGFNNYLAIFKSNFFWKSINNTLFYYIGHFIPVMVISFLLAVILYSNALRLEKFIKVSIFLPVTMSAVASTLIWKVILGTNSGALNGILGTNIPFLDNSSLFRWSVVILQIWKSVGWFMMIYLTGLTTIDTDLFNASKVDGAGPFRTLIFITIPLMKPIFIFTFLTDTMSSLKLFTEPRLLASTGAITPSSNTIVGVLIDYMNAGRFGLSTSVGWILLILISSLSFFQFFVFSRKGSKGDNV